MSHQANEQRGFTLMELLIVIALLGVMAMIVLAALSSAKGKGDDSAIKANLKSAQSQGGLYYSQFGNYGTVATDCTTGTTMFTNTTTYGLAKLITAIQAKSSSVACFSTTTPSSAWVMSAQLKSSPTLYWCVDNTGQSRQRTQPATSTTALCAGY